VAQKQAVVEGALEVLKDVLSGHKMGIMHVEAHLLDRIGDVRLGECEVLESHDQAAIGSWVANGCPHIGGDLGLSVNGRGAGLVAAHASTFKDVLSILSLVKEEVIRLLVY
jgi:hypothetical protein